MLLLVDAAALPGASPVSREFIRVDFSVDGNCAVEQFFQTEYKKTSYGGARFVKVFDLNKLLGIDELPSTEEIANILAEKTWE